MLAVSNALSVDCPVFLCRNVLGAMTANVRDKGISEFYRNPFSFLKSYISFNESPKRLKLMAVTAIMMPGKKTIQGAELIKTLLALIIEPQVAVGG